MHTTRTRTRSSRSYLTASYWSNPSYTAISRKCRRDALSPLCLFTTSQALRHNGLNAPQYIPIGSGRTRGPNGAQPERID